MSSARSGCTGGSARAAWASSTWAPTGAGQRVALKVIRPDLAEDQEFRSRFAREVSAARRIRGGCTARLVAADLEADRPWFATQYVPGPSLHDKVAEEGPLRRGRGRRRSAPPCPRGWSRCTRPGSCTGI